MTTADGDTRLEIATDRADFGAEPLNLQTLVRQVRICRATLGAILDALETSESHPDSLERAAEDTIDLMAEIERLWTTLKLSD